MNDKADFQLGDYLWGSFDFIGGANKDLSYPDDEFFTAILRIVVSIVFFLIALCFLPIKIGWFIAMATINKQEVSGLTWFYLLFFGVIAIVIVSGVMN